MNTEALNQSLVLLVAGMAVVFLFMGLMIVITHYFNKAAAWFEARKKA